jgi:hypothetical protein
MLVFPPLSNICGGGPEAYTVCQTYEFKEFIMAFKNY